MRMREESLGSVGEWIFVDGGVCVVMSGHCVLLVESERVD